MQEKPERYDPATCEPKWQQAWEKAGVFSIDLERAKKPYYGLVMFPYPSGDKLHVGHWYNFGPADSYFRFQKMQGNDVFTPMGFDAFGLPAENYAVKTGVPPAASTAKNVETMIGQLRRMGCMYDWSRTVNTSDPEYYRWTQWVFLKMFEHGLAYKKEGNVNFCPSCQTVLANEQVWDGKCERCETAVIQKALPQWYFRITKYAEKLLSNLDALDWPEKTKTMQRNWIGRSGGITVRSRVKDLGVEFAVWDSVPQTFCAQTFTVIAPEHPLVPKLVQGTKYEEPVLKFCEEIKRKKMANRFTIEKETDGIFTGRYVDNPFGTGDLPIWISSFVVMEYGSGIVHCSAHDERDFAFAKKYGIPLRPVMFPEDPKEAQRVRNLEYCYAKDPNGIMEQPEQFRKRRWGEVRRDVILHLTEKGIAKEGVQYRLRDWLISRQRYWGAPIPIVYDPKGRPHPVPEEHLPWLLPTDVAFKPTGKSPLYDSREFRERTERIFGQGWTPEFDTMDTFVCSSFYYLRYLMAGPPQKGGGGLASAPLRGASTDKQGEGLFIDPGLERKWMPVSAYIGGPEHACMHLIYARFIMMSLKDFGYVEIEEPFKKLVHQGLITNKGAKMSKSKGNVISPDSLVERYGSDVLRMYLMFMGPYTEGADWNDTGIKGIYRFVQRIYILATKRLNKKCVQSEAAIALLHATIKKVGEDIAHFRFNTAISALMELLNMLEREPAIAPNTAQTLARLLAPLAPHLAEELWQKCGGSGFAMAQPWPSYEAFRLIETRSKYVVQVNGKVRAEIEVPAETPDAEILAIAKSHPNVQKHLAGKTPAKEIIIPRKLVSIVV